MASIAQDAPANSVPAGLPTKSDTMHVGADPPQLAPVASASGAVAVASEIPTSPILAPRLPFTDAPRQQDAMCGAIPGASAAHAYSDPSASPTLSTISLSSSLAVPTSHNAADVRYHKRSSDSFSSMYSEADASANGGASGHPSVDNDTTSQHDEPMVSRVGTDATTPFTLPSGTVTAGASTLEKWSSDAALSVPDALPTPHTGTRHRRQTPPHRAALIYERDSEHAGIVFGFPSPVLQAQSQSAAGDDPKAQRRIAANQHLRVISRQYCALGDGRFITDVIGALRRSTSHHGAGSNGSKFASNSQAATTSTMRDPSRVARAAALTRARLGYSDGAFGADSTPDAESYRPGRGMDAQALQNLPTAATSVSLYSPARSLPRFGGLDSNSSSNNTNGMDTTADSHLRGGEGYYFADSDEESPPGAGAPHLAPTGPHPYPMFHGMLAYGGELSSAVYGASGMGGYVAYPGAGHRSMAAGGDSEGEEDEDEEEDDENDYFSMPASAPARKRQRSSNSVSSVNSQSSTHRRIRTANPNKECASCGTRKTPMWRDDADGVPLCNACGIRYKKNKSKCSACNYIPRKDDSTEICKRCHGKIASNKNKPLYALS
ncbi:hypothetical protein CAOG_03836 [Capsaspora owczarzaki ATCC 30864]|uniref:GATA-type domain-containing protein n=1 Tax=Capsaspora owczarzaki (strain ATCC 30864) TaxID=595528 RepID=A0A0D2UD25_CAPO3|nr:hypothetical protein CAOG_03836 [Capsaspora owczarzaki ATCC 30864]KJE92966.1 hypothetical protein CAOG_003836 [Capsaspora owczarzaki ATCC 30864]|eukprot:XP_004363564.1 hypothetical protein CAOG_03836 [Capsaspora owczarzaki ATCC 30864]